VPALNPAFALVEVIWILAGRRDAALPTFWNPQLPRFAGNAKEQAGAYGYRLRAHFGLDQLDRVWRVLESTPDTRQAVLQIWDPRDDLPEPDGTPRRPEIPCNVVAFPKVRGGRLEWLQVLRSNDVFRGLPYNIVQFTALQEVLAGWLGVELGEYVHVSDSLHAYAVDIDAVRQGTSPVTSTMRSTDTLALDRVTSDRVIPDVAARLDGLATPSLVEPELRNLALQSGVPEGYENLLRIAAADSARRRGWRDAMAACREACTNPVLCEAWDRWESRGARPLATEVA
jgi:thymidylate synthase